jgi:putative hydrolase of the HAD superfamily
MVVVSASVVLVDALGTLLRMEPPGPRLRVELARVGFPVDAARADAAFGAEIAYYLEHHLEGRDPSSLAELRTRCAGVLRGVLALPELPLAAARQALLAAVRFEPYPDAVPALRALRERGVKTVVTSNWDCSLSAFLERAGLRTLVDGVVTSAEVGADKPDRRLFEAALAAASSASADALHVGDSVDGDVAGARAAGIRAVLLRRSGDAPPGPPDVPEIASLEDLPSLI